MELRHLRYFVAVAEEGSVTLAAARRLHTAQPSLSRQLRDLEREVGVQLLLRTVRGIELTPAGRAACAGRGASSGIIASRVGASATSLSRSAGR